MPLSSTGANAGIATSNVEFPGLAAERLGKRNALSAAMRIKVYDGTATNSGSTLCGTCRNGTITRGRRLDEELVQCQAMPMSITRITFKVTSCSSYNDVRQPTYLEMLEDAWVLQPASKKRPAGFVRASELRGRELRTILADLHSAAGE